MTTGGDGGNTYKYRTAEQMAITRKKISDKAKAHNSNHGQYIGDKNSMYGKHQSAEAKRKISQGLLGRKKPDSQRIKLSKYYKGKKKSYFPACKYLYLVNTIDNSFTKLQVRQLTKLFEISATEVTNIVKNKLFYKNCYYIVESVSTIPDECKEVGPEISAGSKK